MWDKIKSWWVHLRARESTGVGRDGHGREYPAYLQAMRDIEDQDRSSDGREGEKAKIVLPRYEDLKDAPSMREAIKMEEKDERTGCFKGDIKVTELNVDAVLNRALVFYGTMEAKFKSIHLLVDRASIIASAKGNYQISKRDVALVMSSIAEARMSLDPKENDNYEDTIIWTAILHGLTVNEAAPTSGYSIPITLEDALEQNV